MDEQSTQLADTKPRLETPLRVSIPMNVPARNSKISRDYAIYVSTFSPVAIMQSKLGVEQMLKTQVGSKLSKGKNLDPTELGKNIVNMDHDAQLKTAVKDFGVLAFSSKRAGKKDVEALAYASLGVIYDNQEEYLLAIEQYKLYLQICEEIGDVLGTAAACNCIGVNYMELAFIKKEQTIVQAGVTASNGISEEVMEILKEAIHYHTKHLELGPDPGGKFVANINVGLGLAMIGEANQAARHYQDALRTAIKMQTLYGQSIAVGNLGLLALSKKDLNTARTCFDQHLQLIQALMDSEAEIAAWKLLAELSTAEENYSDAADKLEQARRLAEKEGHLNELRRIHCLIGVTRGTLEFAQYVQSIQSPETYFTVE